MSTSTISSLAELEDVLTTPRPELVEAISALASPLVILGAGGKMGPTLAVLAKRAAEEAGHPLQVVAASRFTDPAKRQWLEERGVQTACVDLLDSSSLQQLPDAQDVLYLVGLKFGTQDNPSQTWAINTLAPTNALTRYPGSRMVALSTGNVYPLCAVSSGGSGEGDPLTPLGEYANAAVARERLLEFHSRETNSSVALMRLNYATDLRYGVPMDLAWKVLRGESIDLSNGFFNCIWQGDANDMILRSFPLAQEPVRAWNLTSPETHQVREVATTLGEFLGREPILQGEEAPTALLSNSAALCERLGTPPTSVPQILEWAAHWAKSGGESLEKPTHFEVRDGLY